jgi:hypothetical protein
MNWLRLSRHCCVEVVRAWWPTTVFTPGQQCSTPLSQVSLNSLAFEFSLYQWNFKTLPLACCPWSNGLRPYILSVSVAVPPARVRVPSQRPNVPSVASLTSVADKGDNVMILGAVHRSSGICLTVEENPRKPQLGDWWRGCATSHPLKWGPFPPNEIGRIAQHVRKGEERIEG